MPGHTSSKPLLYGASSHDFLKQWIGGHVGVPNRSCAVGVEPDYVKMFFCSNKFASLLDTWLKTLYTGSPHVTESKTVLDSGFHTVEFGFQVLDSSLCKWSLDSGFQSLVGFRTPCTVFRILKPRIPNSTCTIFPDFGSRKQKFSGIRNPLHGANRRC